MPRKSNQSILGSLLEEIEEEEGEFEYEEKEPKEIDWASYDQAQINEMNDMLNMIRDLVEQAVENLGIKEKHEEKLKKPGRPPTFPGDLAKTVLMQQYLQTANRPTAGSVLLFKEKMSFSEGFSYKTVERAYDNPDVKDILEEIDRLVQKPIKEKETEFTTDGTGLPTSIKYNYEEEKYGSGEDGDCNMDQFEQAIITGGYEYKMIADFIITDNPNAGEDPYLKKSVKNVSQIYTSIDIWTGDAAYLSRDNTSAIGDVGAVPRIYPKKNDTFRAKGSPEWKQMHYDFIENTQKWLEDYHKRSISETINSAFLRMYPKPLTRRLRSRRKVEGHTRKCGYNIKRLVHLQYLEDIKIELGPT